ncbi:HET-domain-containing protein [Trematosphaeria pertusa]|uniref:HET-domain-containing protein n=1 Tax=Trematosphaeria pertusa TaxID=390896 RepID=A0A6A6IG71_9PLEO|nr:HET-domain-containing protein [Trematosphaeria pertusa]KAF2249584.1 HET-domain-containing protein [Trematosphaeria pertusa]
MPGSRHRHRRSAYPPNQLNVPFQYVSAFHARMLYTSLDESRRQIRLLHLLPGTDDEELHCALSLASLDDEPEYEALSYVWGDAKHTIQIQVDGQPWPITRNLHLALKNLRSEDQARILWVDAVCINQQDIAERNSQVSMMGAIYGGASTVVAYLGEAFSDCELAIELFQQIVANKDLHPNSSKSPSLNVRGAGLENHRLRSSLIRFLISPWCTRIWTAQEFLLAKCAMLQRGSYTIPGSYLFHLKDYYRQHLGPCCYSDEIWFVKDEEWGTTVIGALLLPWEKYLDFATCRTQLKSFSSLFEIFRGQKATDLRDKIFAVRELASTELRERLRPDYAEIPEEVYQSAALLDYQITNRLDFLSFCCSGTRLDLPSWVPDWSIAAPVVPHCLIRSQRTAIYRACGNRKADLRLIAKKAISIGGFCFDTITLRSSSSIEISNSDRLQEIRALAGIEQDGDRPYCNGNQSVQEACWLSLCGGLRCVRDGNILSRLRTIDNRTEFEAWQRWMEDGGNGKGQPISFAYMTMAAVISSWRRCFVRTSRGYMGWAPDCCRAGDVVVVLNGGLVPYVLRQLDETEFGQKYTFLGDAYIHGIMDGEAFEEMEQANRPLEEFILV